MRNTIERLLPIALILVSMSLIYFSGFYRALSFETLRYHHLELTEYVNNNPVITPFMFTGAYAVATALSIPGGIFLSILGGYLFDQPWCTLYVVIGATGGATLLFLSAKTALGNSLREKVGPRLKKMGAGFQKNAASYILFLRFVPLFPFWLVNLAPAFFGIRLRTYIWTTLVGILPGAFVFTQAGRGFNAVFETSPEFTLSSVFNLQVKIALIGLGLLSLVPIAVKKWKEKKNPSIPNNPVFKDDQH